MRKWKRQVCMLFAQLARYVMHSRPLLLKAKGT